MQPTEPSIFTESRKLDPIFKTSVNISFLILFSFWALGNLIYLVVFSAALTTTNFAGIKLILTLTFFATYYSFVLIVQYRFRTIFNRVFKYPLAIDVFVFLVSSFINFSYLFITPSV